MIPRATYRLQFHKGFPFAAALPLAPYLRQLGISHVYSSPILKARAGSVHGYDVVDCSQIDPELGGENMFRILAAELRAHGIGLIVDIVPNHMAADAGNRWWMDVLEHGRASAFAHYFDIDWNVLDGKVLIAILGKPYWKTLEAGEIALSRDDASGKICTAYFNTHLPLRPEDQAIDPANLTTPEAMHALLERQHYRLAWWRTANDAINWRRFFDVPDLIALNQDAEDAFEEMHAKVLALYREGFIDGVRVDHVDGLADPAGYCRRLRTELSKAAAERAEPGDRAYIVVEKILGAGEALPQDWGVDGTTGYDFMDDVSALQHDPAGAEPLGRLWHEISGRPAEFESEEVAARSQIAQTSFESALTQAAATFFSLAQSSKRGRDIAQTALRRALIRVFQQLHVYRTYATAVPDSPAPGFHFDEAVETSLQRADDTDCAAIAFIADVLRGHIDGVSGARDAVRRFNQLSAPVAAKAVEDTAFYRYGRLLSRNDVGFDPGRFSQSPAEFHCRMQERAKRLPHGLLATATHDHKRGEDVRARLAVLSEVPCEWEHAVRSWMIVNSRHRPPSFDVGDEHRLYQTLAGAWPLHLQFDDDAGLSAFRDRILSWQLKALREGKLRTSWLDPDETYERVAESFARAILDPRRSGEFLGRLRRFVLRIAPSGALNGLVQATLRCTAPGVPDCYQGTEFWDLSLVDPDNRRPVNYSARIESMRASRPLTKLLDTWRDGDLKQALIATLLNFRWEKPSLFADGAYRPLKVRGAREWHAVSFARQAGPDCMVVAVPLRCAVSCLDRPLPDPEFWADTEIVLPDARQGQEFTNLLDPASRFGSDAISCRELFAHVPVAVLAGR